MYKTLIIIIFTTFLTACTPLQFALVNVPSLTYDGQISEDVPYGQLLRQKLDIYVPNIDQKTFPVVVLPNTRLYPDVKFTMFAEDAAKSVANGLQKHSPLQRQSKFVYIWSFIRCPFRVIDYC
jgi:hypothetical protein